MSHHCIWNHCLDILENKQRTQFSWELSTRKGVVASQKVSTCNNRRIKVKAFRNFCILKLKYIVDPNSSLSESEKFHNLTLATFSVTMGFIWSVWAVLNTIANEHTGNTLWSTWERSSRARRTFFTIFVRCIFTIRETVTMMDKKKFKKINSPKYEKINK